MTGAVVTGSFVMAAVGAFYLLEGKRREYAEIFLKVGVIAGAISTVMIIFPTGDLHGKYVARNQPAAIAAMEGLFKTEIGAPIVLMGQPNEETQQIDNPAGGEQRAELSDLRHHQSRGEGVGSDSARPVAHCAAAALLQLSHHGRTRDVVCAADAGCARCCCGAANCLARDGRCGRCC